MNYIANLNTIPTDSQYIEMAREIKYSLLFALEINSDVFYGYDDDADISKQRRKLISKLLAIVQKWNKINPGKGE